MSWYNVNKPRSSGSSLPLVVAAVLAGLVLTVVAYQVFLTIPVRLDGQDLRLNAGTRVADLIAAKRVHGTRGRLVSAKNHKVLKLGGGESAWVAVNGKPADASLQLYASDIVASMNGSDVVEPVKTRVDEVDAPVSFEGTGPVQTVVDPGSAGKTEVTFGTISGEVVSERVITEAKPRLVKRIAPGKGAKLVALTFDDGPWPDSTLKILKILKQNQVPATFFMIGEQAKRMPELAKVVTNAGMAVGNHSESHPNMKRMSFGSVSKQILSAETDITKASGQRPRYFRPPGGNVSPHMKPVLDKQGMKMVLWDVDTLDWTKPPVTSILKRVETEAQSGSVVLMHDGGGDRHKTVEALPYVIQMLKKKGYYFVTLDAVGSGRNTIH